MEKKRAKRINPGTILRISFKAQSGFKKGKVKGAMARDRSQSLKQYLVIFNLLHPFYQGIVLRFHIVGFKLFSAGQAIHAQVIYAF